MTAHGERRESAARPPIHLDPEADHSLLECREALYELQVFLDGECGAAVERAITVHLRHCRPCLRRADFEREVRALVASRCSERAPEGLLDRVLARLEVEQIAGGAVVTQTVVRWSDDRT